MSILTKSCAVISATLFFAAGAAQAATINIIREANDPHQSAFGLHPDTGVDGHEIAGAEISGTYANGAAETMTWEADPFTYTDDEGNTWGSINGYANGNDMNMFMSWDGFELSTTSLLTSLSIDLAPGNGVFDTTGTFDNDPNGGSTQGSSFGYEFELYSAFSDLPGAINVVYSGIVNIAGSTAVGDLFTTMTLDFSGLEGGGLLGDLNFRSDMDVMLYAGDLTPVPLSASMTFLLFGLLGLGLMGRNRRTLQPEGLAA